VLSLIAHGCALTKSDVADVSQRSFAVPNHCRLFNEPYTIICGLLLTPVKLYIPIN